MAGDGWRQENLGFSLYKIGGGKYLSHKTTFLSHIGVN